jgi:hypothetical protein
MLIPCETFRGSSFPDWDAVYLLFKSPRFSRSCGKNVILNDAGRAYVQQARLSLLYGERAVQSARAVMQGADHCCPVKLQSAGCK